MIQLFESKIDKTTGQGPNGDCQEWRGRQGRGQYGNFCETAFSGGEKQKHWPSHRLLWTLIKGTIPEGMSVLHSCDNPPCCNIDHLFLGTAQDNADDKMAKGRGVFPGAPKKLSDELGRKIIKEYDNIPMVGKQKQHGEVLKLAIKYGCSVPTIVEIGKGKKRT